ncbi:MAG: hypothetical protein ABI376_04790 [Caulobacteraceae bacterium]
MAAVGETKVRLGSWKEVATYLQCSERTAKRWEAERGLPIRRLPGGGKSRIHADVAELETWRRGEGSVVGPASPPDPPDPAAARRRDPRRLVACALVGLIAIGGAAFALNGGVRDILVRGRAAPPLEAQRLYVAGMGRLGKADAG